MSLCQNRATPLIPLMYLGVHVHVITSSSTEDEESTQKSSWIEDRKFRLYEWSQWSDIASKSRVSSNLYTKSILVSIPLTLRQPTYPYIMINHHTWVDKGVGVVVGLPTLRSAITRRMWLLIGFLVSRCPFLREALARYYGTQVDPGPNTSKSLSFEWVGSILWDNWFADWDKMGELPFSAVDGCFPKIPICNSMEGFLEFPTQLTSHWPGLL